MNMKSASRVYALAALTALTACSGGGGHNMVAPPASTYDLQAGMANMVTSGLSANVTLSGTVNVNGVSTPFTGTGTFTRAAAVSTTFNGTAAFSQPTTVEGTISAAGQSGAYSTSVTDYFAQSDSAFLGEASSGEYDVAQAPIVFPTMVMGGSSGILGTLTRYTDSTMSVSLGTAQVSYSVMAPVDPGSPISVAVTTQIFDTSNMLIETDVMNYTMSSSNVISLSGASAQGSSGTVTISVP